MNQMHKDEHEIKFVIDSVLKIVSEKKAKLFVGTLVTIIISLCFSFLLKPRYESNALLWLESSSVNANQGIFNNVLIRGSATTPEQEKFIVISKSNLLFSEFKNDSRVKKILGKNKFEDSVEISIQSSGHQFNLTLEFLDPEGASDLLAIFIDTIDDFYKTRQISILNANIKFLGDQIAIEKNLNIVDKLTSLLVEKKSSLMMLKNDSYYAFELINPPNKNFTKTFPNRALIIGVASIAFIAIFLAANLFLIVRK